VLVIVLAAAATGFEIGRSNVTTTTSAVTTSSVSEQTWIAAWPRANGAAYATPTAVAQAFTTQFLAMRAPIVGPFQRGDSRSGEVRVTPYVGGPETTVLVRQLPLSNVWWVLGSWTPDITINQPRALATVGSQFVIAGESTAYEAVMNVTLWSDSLATPVLHTTVMGGSMGARARFQKTLNVIGHPGPATLVMYLISAKDGSVVAASTSRFRLGA